MNHMGRIAAAARAAVEEFPDVPEGIELYRWLWAPEHMRTLRIPVARPHCTLSSVADISRQPLDAVEIETVLHVRLGDTFFRARVGWSVEHRVAVLFFADGGPDLVSFDSGGPVSDAGMHAIADVGTDLLWEENRLRWRRLADELDDGEEWRRGAL